jgi:ribonuclease HI
LKIISFAYCSLFIFVKMGVCYAHMNDPNALNIYTDGSSFNNPRRGGMGIVLVFPENLSKEDLEICPMGYQKATNNQMEIMACVTALEESLKLERRWQRIIIHTDSMYVCDNYPRTFGWRNNKWNKAGGAPVANEKEWKALIKIIQKVGCPVEFSWVKGHAKSEHNKRADQLAKQSCKKGGLVPLHNVNLRKKLSEKKTEIGSIKMLGQEIRIRVITSMPISCKPTRYRVEVISKRSRFFGCVDFVYSSEVMRVGHEFLVRLNRDQQFPQVTAVYRDLTEEKKANLMAVPKNGTEA